MILSKARGTLSNHSEIVLFSLFSFSFSFINEDISTPLKDHPSIYPYDARIYAMLCHATSLAPCPTSTVSHCTYAAAQSQDIILMI